MSCGATGGAPCELSTWDWAGLAWPVAGTQRSMQHACVHACSSMPPLTCMLPRAALRAGAPRRRTRRTRSARYLSSSRWGAWGRGAPGLDPTAARTPARCLPARGGRVPACLPACQACKRQPAFGLHRRPVCVCDARILVSNAPLTVLLRVRGCSHAGKARAQDVAVQGAAVEGMAEVAGQPVQRGQGSTRGQQLRHPTAINKHTLTCMHACMYVLACTLGPLLTSLRPAGHVLGSLLRKARGAASALRYANLHAPLLQLKLELAAPPCGQLHDWSRSACSPMGHSALMMPISCC